MSVSTIRTITEQDEEISARLKSIWNEKKKGLNLTQIKACEKLDVSQSFFSQCLNAKVAIPKIYVIKFAALLKESPDKIDPTITKALKILDKPVTQNVVPVLFTLNNHRPKESFVETHSLSIVGSVYAVEVDTNEYAPFIRQGSHIICDPNTEIKEDDTVFVRLTDGSSFINSYKGREGDRLIFSDILRPDVVQEITDDMVISFHFIASIEISKSN